MRRSGVHHNLRCRVSIRAPHFHAGRRYHPPNCIRCQRFQSAPRTFMRGDRWMRQLTGLAARFNPRPALSCGATSRNCSGARGYGVSIRAPHFHAGRRCASMSAVATLRFQSAPRTFMRGDQAAVADAVDGAYVSIRAPHFHAGRRALG